MPASLAPDIEQPDEVLADPYPEQFERFYSESRGRIYNLAARVVGDPDDAADITQEVFLRAFAHPPDTRGQQDPGPWLYRVAMNVCYDHLRRRSARATTPLDDAGEIAAVGDGFAESEMTQAVEAALGSLNVRYRTALVLKDLHGLETGEVAEAMGVSPATARVLLHRSRSAFRSAFRAKAPAGAVPALGLAAFLPDLALPASLQTLVPFSATLIPAAPAMLAPLPVVGLLAKIGGALSAKGAAVALVAAVVAGGGMAANEMTLRGGDGTHTGGGASASSVSAGVAAAGMAGAAHDMSPRAQRRMQEGAQKMSGAQKMRAGLGEKAAGGGTGAQSRPGQTVEGGSGGGSAAAASSSAAGSGSGGGGQASSGGGTPQSGAAGSGTGGGGAH